ncbi:MAG TPA: alpha/beta hydrolase [Deltaproteobacteria bacterium]|nr:alpha/beta hydrolase [Deltaproteobacteria bacterium]
MEREDIEFLSEGLRCKGWFFRSLVKNRPYCIVIAHGFCGVKEMRLDTYAGAFADAGYSTLVFDYRHFGGSQGEPRQILDIKKQHQDWHAAIRFARELPGIDPEKIILWGTSFSGGHVIPVAVKDGRIVAVISQVPHLNGIATVLANKTVQNMRLGIAAWRDMVRMILGRSPYYVPAVGQPGDLAAMTAPDAEEGVKRLCTEGFEPNTDVAARIFLSVGLYSPGRLAGKMDMPWLVQAASHDMTTPVGPAIKAVMSAPKSQLIIYKCGHFDVYVEPRFDQTIGDQITFLNNCLE